MTGIGTYQPSHDSRYGRLTYTSFDHGGGAGGWQVKQRIGLDEDEAGALRSRVNTQLDAGVELPRFPSPADIAQFPRRLVYAPSSGGAAWWHVAPAGNDASGRPGNVFATVILDRTPGVARSIRPIELWRSSDWPVPYGADEVTRSELAAGGEPVPGSQVTLESVLNFLLDLEVYRLGTLGALLDACAAAIAGGPRVVLIADTIDTAALWVGAVSFLMPVRFARESFFFSILERASGVTTAFGQGVHLACLPRLDRDAAEGLERVVVIDEHEDIDIGDLGGQPHRTSRGFTIAATEWSAIASVAMLDGPTARHAIERMDEVAAGLSSVGSEPAWGLAVVVSEDVDRFVDAAVEASAVITRSSPSDLREDSPVFTAASDLLNDQLGDSAEEAWELLARQDPSAVSAVSQMVLASYVVRAVRDVDWLTRPHEHGVPLPAGSRLGGQASATAIEAVGVTLDQLAGANVDPDTAAVAVAALADLVARLELAGETLDDQISTELERSFIGRLFVPGADELVHRLGAFDERTQARFVRGCVERNDAMHFALPPGHRLSSSVTFWLYPSLPAAVRVYARPEVEGTPLRVELAAHAIVYDASRFVEERPLVAWATLSDSRLDRRDLGPLFESPPWTPDDLLALQQQFPHLVRSEWMTKTLKSAAYSETLKALCWQLLTVPRSHDYLYSRSAGGFDDLVRLRYFEREQWFRSDWDSMVASLREIIAGGTYAASLPGVPLDLGCLKMLGAASVLAGIFGVKRDNFARVRALFSPSERDFNADQQQIAFEGLDAHASLGEVALIAMSADEKFPEPALMDTQYRWIDDCVVVEAGESMPILKHYLLTRANLQVDGGESLKTSAVDRAERLIYNKVENYEKSIKSIDKFAGTWVKTLLAGNGRPGRWKAFLSS